MFVVTQQSNQNWWSDPGKFLHPSTSIHRHPSIKQVSIFTLLQGVPEIMKHRDVCTPYVRFLFLFKDFFNFSEKFIESPPVVFKVSCFLDFLYIADSLEYIQNTGRGTHKNETTENSGN